MDSTATDLREGVALVEGDEPVVADDGPALAESADPAANIFKRLWRIERELGHVAKAQVATVKMESGASYKYNYSGHDVILAAVNPLLAKHGVKSLPTTINHERIGNMTVLTVRVDFINIDAPEDRTSVEMVNYGADKGDKGASKALTNAIREAVKKALNITSEEDKKADETTEYESPEGVTKKDLAAAKEQARANLQQWATAFKAALETAETVKDVQRLERDNKEQLTSDGLPDVTRTFFAELIHDRKQALAAKEESQ